MGPLPRHQRHRRHRRDSLTTNLNRYYQTGDVSWILTSTALVLLMVPGVGFFYSGLARRKSALSLIWLSIVSVAVVSVQWFLWGYSLAFSHSAGLFLGDLQNVGLNNVLGAPSVGSSGSPTSSTASTNACSRRSRECPPPTDRPRQHR
ncbi:ammonium transporter [Teratosphaeria destructans]|uniref:Ammonium transporter n=1 Tax=Teratosphaeria destructans TaxID=418781 RepID=A0A9W7SUY1_9PEZI|nr:ammonium transporter [Teratosphaeria destructans]